MESPQTSPGCSTERTQASRASMSVSSSPTRNVSFRSTRIRKKCRRRTRLDVEGDDRLGDDLGLGRLLRRVLCQTLLLERLGLGIDLLVVGAEQVNLILVVLSSRLDGSDVLDGGGGGGGSVGGCGGRRVSGEGGVLGLVGLDVRVPAGRVGVGSGGGGRGEGLEDGDVRLGRSVSGTTERGGQLDVLVGRGWVWEGWRVRRLGKVGCRQRFWRGS